MTAKQYCDCIASKFEDKKLSQTDVDMLTKMHKDEITDEDADSYPTLEDLMSANEAIEDEGMLAHIEADSPPQPGDSIAGTDLGDQASGMIVSVAVAPQGGYDVLAVVQRSTLESGVAHLRRLDGPPLAIGSLPYSSEFSE